MTFDPARIYDVVHPAPMTYLARRARKPSRDWARMTTPVRLRHVDADLPKLAFVGAMPGPGSIECYALEGVLWTHIKGVSHWQQNRSKHAVMEERHLASFLARGGQLGTDLDFAFSRTPVKARMQDLKPHVPDHEGWTRGRDFSEAEVREIIEDGRETAAARLQGFFADNVVVADDKLLVRCGDPIAVFIQGFSVGAFMRPSTNAKCWDLVSPMSLNERGNAVSRRPRLKMRSSIMGGLEDQPFGAGNNDIQVCVIGARILDDSAFDPLDHAVSLAHGLPEICVYDGLRLSKAQKIDLDGAGGARFDAAYEAVQSRCRDLKDMSFEFAMGGVAADRARVAMAQAVALWGDLGNMTAHMPGVGNVRWTARLGNAIDCIASRDLPLLEKALAEKPSPEDEAAMNGLAV